MTNEDVFLICFDFFVSSGTNLFTHVICIYIYIYY